MPRAGACHPVACALDSLCVALVCDRVRLRVARGHGEVASSASGECADEAEEKCEEGLASSDRLACLKRETYLCEELEKTPAPVSAQRYGSGGCSALLLRAARSGTSRA